jgi:hypothetical protein
MCDDPNDLSSCSPYYRYKVDPADQTDQQAAAFLGKFPPGTRGEYPVQALVADPIGSGYEVYHVNGINALFSDFHAKKIPDISRKLYNVGGSDDSYPATTAGSNFYNAAQQYMAWDYMSKHP